VREEAALAGLLRWVGRTLAFGRHRSALDFGYFASVLDLGHGLGLALSTDGVGSKLLVAQMLDKYDTIGIDCVAMNVNDVLCVGAEPLCMLDYIAVQEADPDLLEQIGRGLYEGARQANICIPGGEIAQVREMIRGEREGRGFDLAGACVGLVPMDRILVGQAIQAGDAVIGVRSSGIHSNGLTLAREVFFKRAKVKPDTYMGELGRTIGEELLVPTRIYVRRSSASSVRAWTSRPWPTSPATAS
jgi:phosphoribosylformylglycinamidine cyclo-ligase